MRPFTLARRVALFTTLGFGIVWAVAILLMASVLWSEQEELFDQQLAESARVMLPLLSRANDLDLSDADKGRPAPAPDLDEALVYRLFDARGQILHQTPGTQGAILPPPTATDSAGYVTTGAYRVYTTAIATDGHALQLAAPMAERREAFREGMAGFLLPMVALLPLTWLFIGWISRRALDPMRVLSAEIGARDVARLDMIDPRDWPMDLVQIAGSVNGLMARLTQALESERAFATNAAHELRTPVAIALAQTQQMRLSAADADQAARLDTLERGLQRMRRLVARLLQLARADAGIGLTAEPQDIARLARLVLDDVVPRAVTDRIVLDCPDARVDALVDPDAFAIILGNLVENALQHDPTSGPIRVVIDPWAPGLSVVNGGPAVHDPAALPARFTRRGKTGFGLGLHICRQIAEQAGGALDLVSPVPGQSDGFMARVTMRGPNTPAA